MFNTATAFLPFSASELMKKAAERVASKVVVKTLRIQCAVDSAVAGPLFAVFDRVQDNLPDSMDDVQEYIEAYRKGFSIGHNNRLLMVELIEKGAPALPTVLAISMSMVDEFVDTFVEKKPWA